MRWLIHTLTSSVGKKLMMALTGLSFCGFLTAHLAGNLTIYGGGNYFNSYAAHLHSLGVLLTVAEWILLVLALIHVLTGLTLFYQNFRSRPVRYKVNKNAGGRTWGSATMPYTGICLVVFITIHLLNFHFVDKTNTTIFEIVSAAFEHTGYVILYVAAMLVAALHVSHGFWSAFQTIGANHPKYMPLIRTLSFVFSLAVAVGFGSLPLYLSMSV
jgi:succinate dehydrogenase / fumarate reductase cytochrome b subunit